MDMQRFFCLSILTAALSLYGNPQGHTLVHGELEVFETGAHLQVVASDRAIIHWDNFSIQPNEITSFMLQREDSAVLNRVTGNSISELSGLLQSNGHVYLLNPNGVFIGKEGVIDTQGFFVSTLEIPDQMFLDGETLHLFGDSLASIAHLGTISTKGGPVSLIAHRIEQLGEIIAEDSSVELFSGHEVLFDPTGDSLLYIQPDLLGGGIDIQGKINALKVTIEASTAPTSLAIGLGGSIEANTIEYIGGEIYLTAKSGDINIESTGELTTGDRGKVIIQGETGRVDVSGYIESHGGNVQLLGDTVLLINEAHVDLSSNSHGGTFLMGGDYQGKNGEIQNAKFNYASPKAFVDVSSKGNGDGGKAIFWADLQTIFYANVNADGGKEGGNGGFVEVSGKEHLIFEGTASRLAPHGKVGTLLLDPSLITINATGPDQNLSTTAPPPIFTYSGSAAPTVLTTGTLVGQLTSGNVRVDANSGSGGIGSITIASPISWTQNLLEFVAGSGSGSPELQINADLNPSGSASLAINNASSCSLKFNAAINHTSSSGTLDISSTYIEFNAGGSIICYQSTDINVTATSNEILFSSDPHTISTVGTGGITLTGFTQINCNEATITTEQGDISLSTTNPLGDMYLNNSTLQSTGGGSIDLSTRTVQDATASNLLTTGAGDITISNTFGGTYTACTFETAGTGSIDLTALVPLLDGCTFTTNNPFALSSLLLTLSSDMVFNTTQPVTIGATQNLTAFGPTSITTSSSLLSFPNGISSLEIADTLTINSTGSVSFGGSTNITQLIVTTTGSSSDIILGSSSITSDSGLSLTAGRNITMGNNINILSGTTIKLIAGSNISMTGTTGSIKTFSGLDITLVIDNDHPSPYERGAATFTLPPDLTLCTNSCAGGPGKVLLFASIPGTNTFPTTINTASYTPGTFSGITYNPGTNEFVGYWYLTLPPPDPPLFQIMYKTTLTTPTTSETFQVAVSEPLTNPNDSSNITEGNLQPPATPSPTSSCRTPSISVQSI